MNRNFRIFIVVALFATSFAFAQSATVFADPVCKAGISIKIPSGTKVYDAADSSDGHFIGTVDEDSTTNVSACQDVSGDGGTITFASFADEGGNTYWVVFTPDMVVIKVKAIKPAAAATDAATPDATATASPNGALTTAIASYGSDSDRIMKAYIDSKMRPDLVTMVTKPADNATSAVIGTAGVTAKDSSGLGALYQAVGTNYSLIVPTSSASKRCDEIYNATDKPPRALTCWLTISVEGTSDGTKISIVAIMPDHSLKTVLPETSVVNHSNVGRVAGIIHVAIWREGYNTDVPLGFIVTTKVAGQPTQIAVDIHPSTDEVAASNLFAYEPGKP